MSSPDYAADGLELPLPNADAIEHSSRLIDAIVARIEARGGGIGFDEYMQMALYEPGLGYYSSASIKFGALGDFVTAPEISPLFGACLARQVEALIAQGCAPSLLEFGAGSGRLCGQILQALPDLESYRILDLSGELKQRQQSYLQNLLDAESFARIEWLCTLPPVFDGIVIANELFDAMPVHLMIKRESWLERGVGFDGSAFAWREFAPPAPVLAAIEAIEAAHGELPRNYCCEINLNLEPWFAALAACCRRGAVIIVDYGYEQTDYYQAARHQGTLECFYRHRMHFDPLILTGLQDITAHVDFDACADAAERQGFAPLGLVVQRRFLLANGLLEAAERMARDADMDARLALSQQVKTLTLPEEMGDQFKVLALARNIALEMPALERGSARG